MILVDPNILLKAPTTLTQQAAAAVDAPSVTRLPKQKQPSIPKRISNLRQQLSGTGRLLGMASELQVRLGLSCSTLAVLHIMCESLPLHCPHSCIRFRYRRCLRCAAPRLPFPLEGMRALDLEFVHGLPQTSAPACRTWLELWD